MANIIDELVFKISGDSSGLEKAAFGAANALEALGGKFKTIGDVIAVGVTAAAAAFGAIGTAAVAMGGNFEAQMSKVEAISGASADNMAMLADKAKEMGAKTKFSASESAQAFEYMAMAGWKTEQMLAGIAPVMSLAAASGENLARVSDIVTDAITAMGLKAEDAAHFADVLAAAATNSNTNVTMMGESFKYAAPLAGALGYSIEDVSVAIGLMANSGVKAEQAGTALRSIFSNLVEPPKAAAEAMEALGISATNLDGSVKPLSRLTEELRAAFAGLTQAEKVANAEAIAGKHAMTGLLAVVNAAPGDYDKLTEAINNAGGAAETMAETMNDNLQGQLVLMKSALEGLAIALYEKMQQPLTNAVKASISAIDELGASMRSGALKDATDKLAQGFSKFAEAALDLAVDALPVLVNILAGAAGAFGTLLNILQTLAPVIVPVVAGFAAFETALMIVPTIEKLKFAIMDLYAVMMAHPYALIAAGVVALVAAIGSLLYALAQKSDVMREATRETEKLRDGIDSLALSMAAARKEHSDNVKDIQTEADATGVLVAKIDELQEKAATSAKGTREHAKAQAELKTVVDTLNGAVEGLNLTYNMERNTLSQSVPQLEALVAARKEAAIAAANQKMAEEEAYNIVKLQQDIADKQAQITARRIEAAESLKVSEENVAAVVEIMTELKYNQIKATEEEINTLKDLSQENIAGHRIYQLLGEDYVWLDDGQQAMLQSLLGLNDGMNILEGMLRNANARFDEYITLANSAAAATANATNNMASYQEAKGKAALAAQYREMSEAREKQEKQADEDRKQAAKASADEIVRIEKQKADDINRLGGEITSALKNQYSEQKDAALNALDAEVEAVKRASEEKIRIYDAEYAEKMKLIDEEEAARLKAIQKEIDAIDQKTKAEDDAAKLADYNARVAELNIKINLAGDADQRARLNEELNKLTADWQRKELLAQRDEQKAALKQQIEDEKEAAKERREALKKELEEEKELEKQALDDKLALLKEERQTIQKQFEDMLKDEALKAEALKLLAKGQQEKVLALLDSYAPNWKTAGKKFADMLTEGVAKGTEDLLDILEDMLAKAVGLFGGIADAAKFDADFELKGVMAGGAADVGANPQYGAAPANDINIHINIDRPTVRSDEDIAALAKGVMNAGLKLQQDINVALGLNRAAIRGV